VPLRDLVDRSNRRRDADAVNDMVAFDPLASAAPRRPQPHDGRRLQPAHAVCGLLPAPLGVVVLNSFRDSGRIARGGPEWPAALVLDPVLGSRLEHVLRQRVLQGDFRRFSFNSLWMTIPATIISTAIGAINGYALSRGGPRLGGAVRIHDAWRFSTRPDVLLPWHTRSARSA